MRVCHLIDHTGIGGAQRMLVDLISAADDSVEISVVALRDQRGAGFMKRLQEEGASVSSAGLRQFDPSGLLRLTSHVIAGSFDIVHAHLDYSTTWGIATVLMRDRQRTAIVSHLHNDPWRQNGYAYRFAARVLARHVDAHIVPTSSIADAFHRLAGDRARRVVCIPPGLDSDYFDPRRHTALEVSGCKKGAAVVGFVGRLVPQKRVDLLVSALPRLLEQDPGTQLLIAGEGPLRTSLVAQCRDLRVESAVRFIDPVEAVAPLYLAMDVLCLPSDFEGFGLVLVEAMALGVPVVATDVIGIRDVIQHERTGLLVPPNDVEALAAAISRLCRDRALRVRLREAAMDDVHSRFLRATMARRIESLYREVLTRQHVMRRSVGSD